MEKENKFFFFIFFMFILSLLIFSFVVYIKLTSVLDKIEIATYLEIGDMAGFDVNNSLLTFGTITSSSSSYRELIIENTYEFPIEVEFSSKGNITELLLFEKAIYLGVGENKSVTVHTIVPIGKKDGVYSGKFIAVIKKSWKDI